MPKAQSTLVLRIGYLINVLLNNRIHSLTHKHGTEYKVMCPRCLVWKTGERVEKGGQESTRLGDI
jgi:hypothetical protein